MALKLSDKKLAVLGIGKLGGVLPHAVHVLHEARHD
jgi:hypothetical protein